MITLPIDASLQNLAATLRQHPSLILVAAPGAGKTTRVPPALIKENLLPKDHPHLIMLQPRRVAARAAAQRIADENHWRLGEDVGYHIRFEKRYGAHTRIRILTEAILTRMLLSDPSLEGIGCVLLDEFHERNLHSDLALAFLREIQQTIRPDLKILVMSATLDAAPIARFLNDCPVITSEGRAFPIDIAYRPTRDRPLESHIATIIDEALAHEGDILVFLPGIGEIDRTRRTLAQRSDSALQVLPLHGSLSPDEQQLALRPAAAGMRKIILATNIAETSLTIDGVRTVIDSGLARVASFDPDRGMNRLDLERISQASATQRAGRAGRQAAGHAFRLWSESEQKHLPAFNVPEIHRVDLAATVLSVHAWGARDPRTFSWFDPPEEPMLAAAESLLAQLQALQPDTGGMSELGRHMLQIPAHPRIARLLLAAINTPFFQEALTLADILSDDTRTAMPGDLLAHLDRPPMHLSRVREQFAGIARQFSGSSPGGKSKLKIESTADLLLLAYPDRVARRRGTDPYAAVMVGGIGLRLTPEALTPALAEATLFLALDTHHDPRNKKAEAAVRSAIPLEESTLKRLFPDDFRHDTLIEYSPQRKKPLAVIRRYFRDLLLREDPNAPLDAASAGKALGDALAPQAAELFRQNDAAAALLARVALLRHYMPEHPWPSFDDRQLRELLLVAAANQRSFEELTESPALPNALRGELPYPLDRFLDQHAPEAIEVPSGSRIKLAYALPASPGAAPPTPILAVRLQELFGLLETPRLAAGRAPVLLHLLSPGYKPIQITSDLKSFWAAAYFDVRKDLRVRYPKHKWPDNPLEATPEAKGRRR